ncbi:UNVERIFIED_CONTAM: hypothetical protein GTU68_020635 [Idotea baltica]|nr:hypothetical protein [Idotea baltica]
MGKLKGVDIRKHGSGNIGATNVFRTCGKPSGTICLLLDFAKGLIPVLIEQQTAAQSIVVLTAFAAIMGHNYSPWIGFKGGKGIATSAGAIAGIMPPVALVLLIVIFIVVTKITKYVSVGSISTATAFPLLTIWGSFHHGKIANGTFAGILAIWKHRANITRIRNGTEHRIGQKKKETSA